LPQIFGEGSDDSFKLQTSPAEIEKQTTFAAGRFQLVEKLRVIGARQLCDCFGLNEEIVETDEICSIGTRQELSFVSDRKRDFRFVWNPPFLELKRQSRLIDKLKKTTAKLAMNFHRSSDNRVALGILLH